MKKKFSTELAYVMGLVILALGTAFMERADFGMSMVVAPAYLVYLKISQYAPWFTFGMAEYCFQALLIVVLSLALRKFRRKYLFSFVTAFLYGNVLDLCMKGVALIPGGGFAQRLVFYILGFVICSLGVAFFLKTYITPEAYELFVKELTEDGRRDFSKVKTIYDICSCLVAVVMSFVFFGFLHFEGVKAGTVICALVNGILIGKISSLLDQRFAFQDTLGMRKYFE